MDAPSLTTSLSRPNTWYLGRPNRQLSAASISAEVHKGRLLKYLQDRDANRAERLLPPKWQQYNIQLAALLWDLPNKTTAKPARIRLLFDKHWHSGNQIKSIIDPVLRATIGKCPLCVEDDSAAHWSVHCNNPRAINIRHTLSKDLRKAIVTSAESLPAHKDYITGFGEEYLKYVFGSNSSGPTPDTWRGLWTAQQLDSFRCGPDSEFIPYPCAAALKKLFLTLGRTLTAACTTLWLSRQLSISELATYMETHPDPNYRPPDIIPFPFPSDIPPLTEQELDTLRSMAILPAILPIVPVSIRRTFRTLLPRQESNHSAQAPKLNLRRKSAFPLPLRVNGTNAQSATCTLSTYCKLPQTATTTTSPLMPDPEHTTSSDELPTTDQLAQNWLRGIPSTRIKKKRILTFPMPRYKVLPHQMDSAFNPNLHDYRKPAPTCTSKKTRTTETISQPLISTYFSLADDNTSNYPIFLHSSERLQNSTISSTGFTTTSSRDSNPGMIGDLPSQGPQLFTDLPTHWALKNTDGTLTNLSPVLETADTELIDDLRISRETPIQGPWLTATQSHSRSDSVAASTASSVLPPSASTSGDSPIQGPQHTNRHPLSETNPITAPIRGCSTHKNTSQKTKKTKTTTNKKNSDSPTDMSDPHSARAPEPTQEDAFRSDFWIFDPG